jgi:mono/diheme cytochrome c family protein
MFAKSLSVVGHDDQRQHAQPHMPHALATRRPSLAFAFVALALVVAGCEPPGKPNPAGKPILPDQVLDFHRLYAANCAGCHGANGQLGPAPPLNDPLFVAIVPEAELLRVIGQGRAGTPMPPFARSQGGPLTEEQVKVLATGIKSHWKPDEPLGQSPPEHAPPEYALPVRGAAQAALGSRQRGAEVFARACGECHGASGGGVEKEGVVENAINVPAFLALVSDQALRRVIITGRPDLGMPTYAEHDGRPDDFQPLSSEEINDLVALLADWRASGATVVQDQP